MTQTLALCFAEVRELIQNYKVIALLNNYFHSVTPAAPNGIITARPVGALCKNPGGVNENSVGKAGIHLSQRCPGFRVPLTGFSLIRVL